MELSESAFQFIWKYRLFKQQGLVTQSGRSVRIERVGSQNFNEGPDFLNALIDIEGVRLAGHIEIDRSSSDWNKHRHHLNEKFNSVILHVVYEHDADVVRRDGSRPETLVLKSHIDRRAMETYRSMAGSRSWIPCQSLIGSVDSFYVDHWLNRLLFDRMLQKSDSVFRLLEESGGDWQQVSYIVLARSFGFSVNDQAFELLARSVPLELIKAYRHDPLILDALFFGQAGMLEQSFDEEYPLQLKGAFAGLKSKHGLKPMAYHHWRFLRMRPANFPTLRIAQFSAFCHRFEDFFSPVLEIENLTLWESMLKSLVLNPYWSVRYRFGKAGHPHHPAVGSAAAKTIFINWLCLLLFAYGRRHEDVDRMDQSFERMARVGAERNSIVDRYRRLGVKVRSAVDTQGLKQLKTIYCDKKRCLDCEIGLQIIKKSRNE
jgi:hypothetical protein